MELKYNYKPCGCGTHCYLFQVNPNEPCWGEIELVEDKDTELDYFYVHVCQGHKPIQDKLGVYLKPYTKSKYPKKINL